MERAAANETTPRIPAHPKTRGNFQPGFGSATFINRAAILVNSEAPSVQINRVIISVKEIIRP